MIANNNVSVMNDVSHNVSRELTSAMQSVPHVPPVGFSPSTHGDPSSAAAQSIYPQSYVSPYEGGSALTAPYNRESMFPNQSGSSASSLPFGGINDIAPSLFGSGMLGPHHYHHPATHPLHITPRTNPGLLNYGQSPMQPPSQHLFPSPSYPGYPNPLHLPPSQPMTDRNLLFNPMISRFPSLHHRGSSPLSAYGMGAENSLRQPFSSLLHGPNDRKCLPSSPSTNIASNSDLDPRGDMNNSRKKRKACGHCGPCQRKENCGSCMNCINRAKGKQICIHRKCEILKKKPGSSSYLPTPEAMPKQEKRKDLDDFVPNEPKRTKTEEPSDLPQGLVHPTLHPNFAEFGDLSHGPSLTHQTNRQQVIESQHESVNPPQTQTGNPSFYQGEQSFHPGGFPASEQASRTETNVQSNPAVEDSDFINQALQEIESNISANQTPQAPTGTGPSSNNSLNDTTNSGGIGTSLQGQGTPCSQLQQQLQSPQQQQQRRVSQHENDFNWNPNIHDKAASSLATDHSQLPGRPPPPTGPGPGSGTHESDKLLNNLRKFNSPTSFHGQSSPVKDPSKAVTAQFANTVLTRTQQKSYVADQSMLSATASGDGLDSTLPPSFDNLDNRQFPSNPPSSNITLQQPPSDSNQSTMFQSETPQYHGQQVSHVRPDQDQRMLTGSYNPAGYPQPNNQSYQSHVNPGAPRPFSRPPFSGSVDYSNDNRFPSFPPNVPQNNFDSKLGGPNSESHPRFQYQQTANKPSFQQQTPPQYDSTFNQRSGMQLSEQRFPGPRPSIIGEPSMDSPVHNGSSWNFKMPSSQLQGQTQHSPHASPHDVNHTDGLVRPSLHTAQPSYPNLHRRASRNPSAECFPGTRHLPEQPLSNGSTNRSPMVQNSPAGPVVTHSPFASSAGSSLRSPVSTLMTGSPVPQYQGATSSPSVVTMPHLSTSPNVANHHQGETPSMSANPQAYRPWHEPQGTALRTHPRDMHSSHYRSEGAKPESMSSASNHFLAQPGSSLNMPPHQRDALSFCANVDQQRPSVEGAYVGNGSFAAARLSVPDNQEGTDKIGLNQRSSQSYMSSDKAFANTMNSILYGKASKETHGYKAEVTGNLERQNKAVPTSSPTDAHSTISPGESGYDSAELSSVVSDNMLHHNVLNVPPRGNESLSIEGVLLENVITSDLSKNAYAASVGSENQQVRESSSHGLSKTWISPESSTETGDMSCTANLLPAEAASTVGYKPTVASPQLQTASTASVEMENKLPHNCKPAKEIASLPIVSSSIRHSVKGRSVSLECEGRPSKLTVPLRRYSYQGTNRLEPTHSNRVRPGRYFQTNKSTFSVPFTSINTPTAPLYSPNVCTPPGRLPTFRENPLDTPPQTPLGSLQRNQSTESTHCQLQQHYALPTPPHSADERKITYNPQQGLTSDQLRGYVETSKGPNNTLVKKSVFPGCSCLQDTFEEDAPYYTHLGAASDFAALRKLFEQRCGITGKELRIEKVQYTGKEGKTSHGCPIAKWVLRRSGTHEKVLVVGRKRRGHKCPTAVVAIVIMLWDGLERPMADFVYSNFVDQVPTNGEATERRCGTNEERTCACQGFDDVTGGASFSFGCSWSMFYNGCKYARSVNPNKFKLNGTKNGEAEKLVENICERLSSDMGALYKMAAPDAHKNQTEHEEKGSECRLGHKPTEEGRPFSGVTLCMDFCAHAHKDQNNMDNGSTIVLTLTKPELRDLSTKKRPDEQLHVLPLYKLDLSNEDGTYEGVIDKINSGATEILTSFPRRVRLRAKPVGTAKQRKDKKRRGEMYSSPAKKKRGRTPKRSHSMEDLTSIPQPAHQQTYQEKQNTYGDRPQQMFQKYNSHAPIHTAPPLDVIYSPPPRWPYRRHPSSSPSIADSNLPSIGSIFSPGGSNACSLRSPLTSCGTTPPLTPRHGTPSPMLPAFQFGRRLSTTSSTSDEYVRLPTVAQIVPALQRPHPNIPPTHNLGTSQSCTSGQQIKWEPDAEYPFPISQRDHKINLKTYASNQLHHNQQSCFFTPEALQKPPVERQPKAREYYSSDAKESFDDSEVGGVAIAPTHGSVLIECAKRELHATTPLLAPNRFQPSRISMVFYQHKNMNYRNHGASEYEEKENIRNLKKAKAAEEKRLEEIRQQQETQDHKQEQLRQDSRLPQQASFAFPHQPQLATMQQQLKPPSQTQLTAPPWNNHHSADLSRPHPLMQPKIDLKPNLQHTMYHQHQGGTQSGTSGGYPTTSPIRQPFTVQSPKPDFQPNSDILRQPPENQRRVSQYPQQLIPAYQPSPIQYSPFYAPGSYPQLSGRMHSTSHPHRVLGSYPATLYPPFPGNTSSTRESGVQLIPGQSYPQQQWNNGSSLSR